MYNQITGYTVLEDRLGKLYHHVLKLEERIKALEKKNDDDESYYQEQQEN